MTEYKDEMIKKMEAEKEENMKAIQHAAVANKDLNHQVYLNNLNIKRWEKENKAIDKQIEGLKG